MCVGGRGGESKDVVEAGTDVHTVTITLRKLNKERGKLEAGCFARLYLLKGTRRQPHTHAH